MHTLSSVGDLFPPSGKIKCPTVGILSVRECLYVLRFPQSFSHLLAFKTANNPKNVDASTYSRLVFGPYVHALAPVIRWTMPAGTELRLRGKDKLCGSRYLFSILNSTLRDYMSSPEAFTNSPQGEFWRVWDLFNLHNYQILNLFVYFLWQVWQVFKKYIYWRIFLFYQWLAFESSQLFGKHCSGFFHKKISCSGSTLSTHPQPIKYVFRLLKIPLTNLSYFTTKQGLKGTI